MRTCATASAGPPGGRRLRPGAPATLRQAPTSRQTPTRRPTPTRPGGERLAREALSPAGDADSCTIGDQWCCEAAEPRKTLRATACAVQRRGVLGGWSGGQRSRQATMDGLGSEQPANRLPGRGRRAQR